MQRIQITRTSRNIIQLVWLSHYSRKQNAPSLEPRSNQVTSYNKQPIYWQLPSVCYHTSQTIGKYIENSRHSNMILHPARARVRWVFSLISLLFLNFHSCVVFLGHTRASVRVVAHYLFFCTDPARARVRWVILDFCFVFEFPFVCAFLGHTRASVRVVAHYLFFLHRPSSSPSSLGLSLD